MEKPNIKMNNAQIIDKNAYNLKTFKHWNESCQNPFFFFKENADFRIAM